MTRAIRAAGLILGGLLAIPGVLPAKTPARATIAQTAKAIQPADRPSGVSGWMVVDLDTGAIVDASNADRGFVPASVAKLPTAAFALDALGPEHRFRTRALVLDRTLVLAGSGDPELDTDGLADLVSRLPADLTANRLLVDGSTLPQLAEIEPTQGEDAAYNPSLSGLNLNYNRVHVKWDARGNRRFLAVEAEATRRSPGVTGVSVSLDDAPGAPLFRHRFSAGTEHWQMARRAFRGRGARWLPVKAPEQYAGEVFAILAVDRGLRLPAAEPGGTPRRAREVASVESRPLALILRDMLRFSTNLTAEAVGTAAARALGRPPGSLRASATTLNLWAAGVGGFAPSDPGFQLANHSGLSLDSRLSPRRMVAVLRGLARRPADPGHTHPRLPGRIAGYLKPLPVTKPGTEPDTRLVVVAKTGTIAYVRGLAGYIATAGGRRLAFAVFSNDLARRSAGAQRVNKGWMHRARVFERALIRSWAARADTVGG